MSTAATAWVALGSNLGNRAAALARLRSLLAADGVVVAAVSTALVTRPVGELRQPDFLNQAVRLESTVPLAAHEWLRRCRDAETAAGRRPTWRWGPRVADADIALLGPDGSLRVVEPDLVVPHPALGDRPFLCALLASLDRRLRHPDGWRLADRAGAYGWLLEEPRG